MNIKEFEKLIHFFNDVKIYLGLYDWKINFKHGSHDCYCWKDTKTIDIGTKVNCKEFILHELSHCNTSRFCNNHHDRTFNKQLDLLMWRFLKKRNNTVYREYEGIGYYRKIYEN